MKKTILILSLFITLVSFSQSDYTMIVDGKEVHVKNDGAVTPNNVNVRSGVHVIKKGENLYSISRLYNLTVDELCKMNNIDKNHRLSADESLRIVSFSKNINTSSSNFTNASYHIVKKEDTLYNISKRYGLTVSKLKELNDLTNNLITINQRLRIN